MAERGRKPKRLRPWLIALIDGGTIDGLEWLDESKELFKIPWLHKNSQCWKEEDGRIFMEWAKHTGKYVEGVTKKSYAGLKQRLRSAFNKAPDIQFQKELTRQYTSTSCPVKIYKLLPLPVKNAQQASAQTPSSSSEEVDFEGDNSSMEEGREGGSGSNRPSTSKASNLPNLKIFDEPLSDEVGEVVSQQIGSALTENRMIVRVYYSGHLVSTVEVNNPNGCYLYYADPSLYNQDFVNIVMQPILLPPYEQFSDSVNPMHLAQGALLLKKGLNQIVALKTDDHSNILAYRLCKDDVRDVFYLHASDIITRLQEHYDWRKIVKHCLRLNACAVFHHSEATMGLQPLKLPRGEYLSSDETIVPSSPFYRKIFDYGQDYIPHLKDYIDGKRFRPNPNLYLVFGQCVTRQDMISSSTLIHVTVTTARALQDLQKADSCTLMTDSPTVEMSVSNEFDRLVSACDITDVSTEIEVQAAEVLPSMDLQFSPDDVQFNPANWDLTQLCTNDLID